MVVRVNPQTKTSPQAPKLEKMLTNLTDASTAHLPAIYFFPDRDGAKSLPSIVVPSTPSAIANFEHRSPRYLNSSACYFPPSVPVLWLVCFLLCKVGAVKFSEAMRNFWWVVCGLNEHPSILSRASWGG